MPTLNRASWDPAWRILGAQNQELGCAGVAVDANGYELHQATLRQNPHLPPR